MGDALVKFSYDYDNTEIADFISAERYVSDKLVSMGHTLLAHNYLVHNVGEIDIVSYKDGVIYATEVKARSDKDHFGGAKAQFTQEKQKKVLKTLRHFAKNQGQSDSSQKLLAATVEWDENSKIKNCDIYDWELY